MSEDAGDDIHFSQAAALRNGTPVTIRALRPDDRERLIAAFKELDPSTVYTRFFTFVKEIPAASLQLVDEVDFDHVGALVATIGSGADEVVIGGASYVCAPPSDEGKSAEVAFTVEEDYQGQGLASRLLALLVPMARRHGVTRFEADVLSGNAPMLAVFQRSGLPTQRRSEGGGVVHLTMALAPQQG